MKDRVSANPGRVLITPEDGSGAFYATLAMADNPTVVGTPLNKASLLTDATAALFGLGPDAVPDDAFMAIPSLVVIGSSSVKGPDTTTQAGAVELGFKPRLLIVFYQNSSTYIGPAANQSNYNKTVARRVPVIVTQSGSNAGVEITETGFTFSAYIERYSATIQYIAWK